MIDALSTPHNRIRTLILLAICGLSAIAAAVVGIDDNPPGILLAFLAATAFVLAFAHPWRTSRQAPRRPAGTPRDENSRARSETGPSDLKLFSKQFRRLLYGSALGFVVFGLLHIVFEAIASNGGGSGLVQDLLNGAGAVFFLIAVLVCPPGMLVGAVGAVVTSIRNRGRPTPGPTAAA